MAVSWASWDQRGVRPPSVFKGAGSCLFSFPFIANLYGCKLTVVFWLDNGYSVWKMDMQHWIPPRELSYVNKTQSFIWSQSPVWTDLFQLITCAHSSTHIHAVSNACTSHIEQTMFFFFHLLSSSASSFDVGYPGARGIQSWGIKPSGSVLSQ